MKETMSKERFINGMVKYGGGEGFSYAGLDALWHYLQDYEGVSLQNTTTLTSIIMTTAKIKRDTRI